MKKNLKNKTVSFRLPESELKNLMDLCEKIESDISTTIRAMIHHYWITEIKKTNTVKKNKLQ